MHRETLAILELHVIKIMIFAEFSLVSKRLVFLKFKALKLRLWCLYAASLDFISLPAGCPHFLVPTQMLKGICENTVGNFPCRFPL